MKETIMTKADQMAVKEIEDLKTENNILKSKLDSLEDQLNTRSRSDEEGRARDFAKFEHRLRDEQAEVERQAKRAQDLERELESLIRELDITRQDRDTLLTEIQRIEQ